MATTKIWPIKGWLGQVVVYVENPAKTERPEIYKKSDLTETGAQGLEDVIDYAMAKEKTVDDEDAETLRSFVTGINCTPTGARRQMMKIKSDFDKSGGVVALHGYQAFALGEVTPEIAHEIGVKLAEKMWGDRHQVIVATHLDKSHIHNHFVINTVSFIDGKKLRATKPHYYEMRDTSDELCREYHLSVIENPQLGKAKQHGEWQADREGKPTWRSVIKSDIDEAIARARTGRQFLENLETLGYEYKEGSDISVRPPGKERFFRLARNFGDEYSPEGIRAQLIANQRRLRMLPVPKYRHPDFVAPKKLPAFAKGSIVALHRRYLYLLGYYQQHGNPSTNARMHYLLREDIRKPDEYIEDTKLLGREKIESVEQLCTFWSKCESEIGALSAERANLRTEIRAETGFGNSYSTKNNSRYQDINARLKKNRKEVVQCRRIKERSHSLVERIDRIEQDEKRKLWASAKERLNGRHRVSGRSGITQNTFER